MVIGDNCCGHLNIIVILARKHFCVFTMFSSDRDYRLTTYKLRNYNFNRLIHLMIDICRTRIQFQRESLIVILSINSLYIWLVIYCKNKLIKRHDTSQKL